MKKSTAKTSYKKSNFKQKNISLRERRELNSTVTLMEHPEEHVYIVDDTFVRELSLTQWAEDRSRETTLRDAALGYCTVLFQKKDGETLVDCDESEAQLVTITRPYRRFYGGMSVNSLLSASRNKNRKGKSEAFGVTKAVADYANAIIFSSFNDEEEMWLQFVEKAAAFYGTDEFEVQMKLVDRLTYHVDNGNFDVTIDIWEFVPVYTEAEEVEEPAAAE